MIDPQELYRKLTGSEPYVQSKGYTTKYVSWLEEFTSNNIDEYGYPKYSVGDEVFRKSSYGNFFTKIVIKCITIIDGKYQYLSTNANRYLENELKPLNKIKVNYNVRNRPNSV